MVAPSGGNADETIIIQYVAEVNQAIKNVKILESTINELKANIAKVATETQTSFKMAAKAIENAAKSSTAFKTPEGLFDTKAFTKWKVELSMALSELTKEQQTAAQARSQAISQERQKSLAEEKAAAKERAAFETQLNATLISIEKQRISQSISLEKQRAAALKAEAQAILAEEKRLAKEQESFEKQLAKVLLDIKKQGLKEEEQLSKSRAAFWKEEAKIAMDAQKQQQSGWSKLSDAASYFFGTVLGITALAVLQEVVQLMKQLWQGSIDTAKAMMQFEVSVRVLQKRGLDITMKQAAEQVRELRDEFKFLTTQESMELYSQIGLMTQGFGFSTDEMNRMAKVAANLALIMGKDVVEGARQATLFISSGYAEGLQKAGLSINKATVAQKAYELGLISTQNAYQQLTEKQRAHVALLVLEEASAALATESQKALASEYGKVVQAQAELREEQQKLQFALIPLQTAWNKFIVGLLKAFQTYRQILVLFNINLIKYVVAPTLSAIEAMSLAWDKYVNGQDAQFRDLSVIYQQYVSDLTATILKTSGLEFNPFANMEDVDPSQIGSVPLDEFIPEDDEVTDAYKAMFLDIQDALDKYQQDMIEAEEEFMQELADIDKEWLDKRAEIWKDYGEKIADINRELAQDIEDAERDLQYALEDLEIDTQHKLEDAARKYREQEIKAEREYQEKLRRLREEFLFDLEDALRERDALQVLRLIRRYKLDVEQAERQHEAERQERQEAYRQEIDDIKRQAERKRQELLREHEQKLEDLRIQAERERQQAAEDRDQALKEADEDRQRAIEEAKEDYDQQLRDLKDALQDQLNELMVNYALQEGVTLEHVQAMSKILQDYFGPGGPVEGTFSYLVQMIQNATAAAIEAMKQLEEFRQQLGISETDTSSTDTSSVPQSNPEVGPGKDTISSNAEGGMMVATSPQVAMFGEVPEMVQFTPISKLNTKSLTSTSEWGNGSGGGKGSIEIWLSPGLEASVVDNALGQVADIIVRANERR